jgi:hypothetical protein
MTPNIIGINPHVLAEFLETSHLLEALAKIVTTGNTTKIAKGVAVGTAMTTKIARKTLISARTLLTLTKL